MSEQGQKSGKALGGPPLHDDNAVSPSSGVTPLEVFNMTGVAFMKETKAGVIPPRFQAFPV